MLYTQFNMEDAKEVWQEEAYNEGLAEGDLSRSRQNIRVLLADMGEIPEDIHSRIDTEKDTEILQKWLKVAARAKSFEDFREGIG